MAVKVKVKAKATSKKNSAPPPKGVFKSKAKLTAHANWKERK
jgi:hypothetical protein